MRYPIDQTSDPGFSRLTVLLDKYPNLYKVAHDSNLDASEFEELNDTQFAWSNARRFPIHDKGHVALSCGYCKFAQGDIPDSVVSRLEKTARLYNIDLNVVFPEVAKLAEDTSYYLLPEQKRFRVKKAEDVSRIEGAYREKYAQLTADERASVGLGLVRASNKYKVPLSPSTLKLAGFTVTNIIKAADWIEARGEAAVKVGSVNYQPIYTSLANNLRNLKGAILANREEQTKLASVVNELDQKSQITPFYGKYLPDPLQTVFNTDRQVSDLTKVGSVMYDRDTLSKVPLTFWEDVLGSDITKEIAPNNEVDMDLLTAVLPTLPTDIKTILNNQLTPYTG